MLSKTLRLPRSSLSLFNQRKMITPKNQVIFPETVDLLILGRCNLNCPWCWGPEHYAKEPVLLEQWKTLIKNLQNAGTKNIVISGGEPLLKSFLPDLLQYAHSLKMRTTLSTNGILLPRLGHKILPYTDDLGLPLDGHNASINSLMRVGKFPHFEMALEAIKNVQTHYPNIELTVRTVISEKNKQSVPFIGQALINHGINPKALRWKLYQVNPIGPRKSNIHAGNWLISQDEFQATVNITKTLNPEFIHLTAQNIAESAGRYFIVFPDGKSHIITNDINGFPIDVPLGNIIHDFNGVSKTMFDKSVTQNNLKHGTDANNIHTPTPM